ncbi:MAG: DUF3990 domain-containing protein [Phascolarctobacterium sp.]|nr:DUF3990 domain-containing protein [Phascolarctobacterium sp.]
MKLRDGMLLYHGSYTPVEIINLTKCEAGKDFGRGFYVTANETQARSFIKTSLLKAKARNLIANDQNYGYVTCYEYHVPYDDIPAFSFKEADEEWLWFIALNRRAKLAREIAPRIDPIIQKSEIIIGKIANDTTNPVITAFLNGIYGPIMEERSAQIAISLLLPNRLKEQYCFLTQRAVNCLKVVEVSKYEL